MNQIKNNLPAGERPKKYPIRCVQCGQKEVRPAVVTRDVKKNHDGRVYDLHVQDLPVTLCSACSEVYFTAESDEAIVSTLRNDLGLLAPAEIRSNLRSLNLSQKDAAARLGIAAETLSRWLSGAMIQSRAMDNLLRGFFACPELREKLTGDRFDRSFGVLAEASSVIIVTSKTFAMDGVVDWSWKKCWPPNPVQPVSSDAEDVEGIAA